MSCTAVELRSIHELLSTLLAVYQPLAGQYSPLNGMLEVIEQVLQRLSAISSALKGG